MKKTKLSEIAAIFGTESKQDRIISSISTDTRTIATGSLFIPVCGASFDGHNFIGDAFRKGAEGAICEISKKEMVPQEFAERTIFTGDTVEAMLKIAAWHRSRFQFPITAVTGSNGKTTAKDLLKAIMSGKFETVATKANFNNEIGVPATVLSFDESTEFAIIEMGMRGKGQIRQLAEAVRPTSAIITMIGEAHFELLGSRQAIAEAKSEITEFLPESGFTVMNGDSDFAGFIKEKSKARTVFFGKSDKCDLRILSYKPEKEGFRIQFDLRGRKFECFEPLAGAHNVYNAAAAILSACESGAEPEYAAERIANVEISGGRTEILHSEGRTIINDCYNSSPSSAAAAIETLRSFKGFKAAIIGDMLELGSISQASHYELGAKAASSGIDLLLAGGNESKAVIRGALEAGMPSDKCIWFERADDFPEIAGILPEECSILVKASHSMEFEKITKYLIKTK